MMRDVVTTDRYGTTVLADKTPDLLPRRPRDQPTRDTPETD